MTANLVWGSDLELGLELIDEQHRELFERINRLLDACQNRKGKEEAGRLLEFLESYVVFHFEAEEKLQQSVGFPGAEAHRGMHDGFRKSLTDLRAKFDHDGPSLSFVMAIQTMVVEWLVNHIGVHDRAIARYMKR